MLHPDLGAALGGERFLSDILSTARLQQPHTAPHAEGAGRSTRLAFAERARGTQQLRADEAVGTYERSAD